MENPDFQQMLQNLIIQFEVNQASIQKVQDDTKKMFDSAMEMKKAFLGQSNDLDKMTEEQKQQSDRKWLDSFMFSQERELEATKKKYERLLKESETYYKEDAELRDRAANKIESKIREVEQLQKRLRGGDDLSEGFNKAEQSVESIARLFAPMIATGFGTYALVKNLKEAADEIREIQFQSTQLAMMTGSTSPELTRALVGAQTQMQWMGWKPEETQKRLGTMIRGGIPIEVVESLTKIGGGGMAGVPEGRTGLEAIAGAGISTGLGTEGVISSMTVLSRYAGVAGNQLLSFTQELSEAGKSTKLPVQEFTESVLTLTKTNARWHISLEDSTDLVKAFSEELHSGKMSVQDLSNIQKGAVNMSIGSMAYMAQQVQTSPELMRDFPSIASSIQGMGAFPAAATLREMAQQGKTDELTRLAFRISEMQAAQVTGTEGPAREAVETYFFQQLPFTKEMGLANLPAEQMRNVRKYMDNPEAFSEALEAAKEATGTTKTPEQAIVDGMKALEDSLGPSSRFMIGWREFWRSALIDLKWVASYLNVTGGREMREEMMEGVTGAEKERAKQLLGLQKAGTISDRQKSELALLPFAARYAASQETGIVPEPIEERAAVGMEAGLTAIPGGMGGLFNTEQLMKMLPDLKKVEPKLEINIEALSWTGEITDEQLDRGLLVLNKRIKQEVYAQKNQVPYKFTG